MLFTTHARRRLRSAALLSSTTLALLSCGPSTPEWNGSFRGLGQEPGWLVEVEPDRLRWLGDYGEVEFVTGAPRMEERSEGALVWTASTEAHEIRVSATDEVCHDVMSGQEFTHTVTVEVDGGTLRGCGRWQEGSDDE